MTLGAPADTVIEAQRAALESMSRMVQRGTPSCVVKYTWESTSLYLGRMTALERAEQKVTLLRQADVIVERLRVNEVEHGKLLDQRDLHCRDLRAAGATIKELQDVLGMSRSRVQQILRGSSR